MLAVAIFGRSHGSTVQQQCLVRCPRARPASAFAASDDEWLERCHRAELTGTESSHGHCGRRVQSHAATRLTSNAAIYQSSAPQKTHTVGDLLFPLQQVRSSQDVVSQNLWPTVRHRPLSLRSRRRRRMPNLSVLRSPRPCRVPDVESSPGRRVRRSRSGQNQTSHRYWEIDGCDRRDIAKEWI